ncbi:ABC transporter permease [Alphaproteobacteria bacterium]|jgi:peptide/nickel transport system permease protein|nr:ABC transporter permease [Alphaproteobacteria bacterium]
MHINQYFKFLRRFYRGNLAASIGSIIVATMILLSVFAGSIAENDPNKRVARGHQPPSAELLLGSTRSGKDVLSQVLHGGKISLLVAFSAAMITTVIAVAVGISAGYFGGRVDEILMSFTNIVLVFPQLPLLIIIAAFVGQVGPIVIALIIGLSSWAWGARVIRSQTMAIRNKEFIIAAEVMGESKLRIMFMEILPNLISIVVGGAIGTCIYALMAEAGLEFLGLGDPTIITWGTMLFWAQSNSAFIVGAWWDMVVPGTAIAIFGGGLALLNMSIDQLSNPKLKTGGYIKTWRRMKSDIEARRTEA